MALTDENKKVADDVIDLNIDGIKKSRFKINKDPNAILELNTSDVNIGFRLEKGYLKMQEELRKISEIPEDDESLSEKIQKSDKIIREQLDYIFDSNVSEVCGQGGLMIDPIDGMYRFEHILEALTKLYSENLNNEYIKLKQRLKKYENQSKSNRRKGK